MILNSVRFPPLCDRLGFTNEIASFTSPCLCIFVVAYSSRLGIREPSMIHVTALRLFTIAPGRVRPFLFLYLKAAFICHISMYMQCLQGVSESAKKIRMRTGGDGISIRTTKLLHTHAALLARIACGGRLPTLMPSIDYPPELRATRSDLYA